MLTILGYVALALVLAIAIILALAARKPDHFRAARAALVAATPERLFPLIANLRAMNTWNPYALRETSGRADYTGPDSGKGARFDFAGPKSGTGHVEIIDTMANERAELRLVMTKPFKCDNRIELTLRPRGERTEVTWAMSGRQPLMGKVMTLFMDCDAMIGRDFDEGLGNLKRIAEAA